MSKEYSPCSIFLFLVITVFSVLLNAAEIKEFNINSINAQIIESKEDGILNLNGNVVIDSDVVELWADEATYDTEKRLINLKGNIRALSKSLAADAELMTADFLNKHFFITNSSFNFQDRGFGKAQIINIRAEGEIELLNVSITSCKNDDIDWQLSADEIKILENKRNAVTKDIWVKLNKIPIFYLPYTRTAIGNEKFSGFLAPSLKQGKDGIDISAPYFLSLAPNYDLTIAPRYIQNRGNVVGAEGRYLTGSSRGRFSFSYLEKDRKFYQQTSKDTKRWATKYYNRSKFNNGFAYEVNTEHVSDIFYFEDLDDDIVGSQQKDYLTRNFKLSWISKELKIKASINQFENLSPLVSEDYHTQPNIEVDYEKDLGFVRLGLVSDFSKLTYDELINPFDKEKTLKRIFVEPSVEMVIDNSYSSTIFKVGARTADYDDKTNQLENTYKWAELSYKIFLDKSQENRFSTFSPMIKYIWVDAERNFKKSIDSKFLNLNYENLFKNNWYTGQDLFLDRNRLVVGLERTSYEYSHGQEVYLSFGRAYFENNEDFDNTYLVNESPFVSEFKVKLGNNLRVDSAFELTSNLDKFLAGHIGFRYEWEKGTDIRLRSVYKRKARYLNTQEIWKDTDQPINQIELISQWKVSDHIAFFGKVIRDQEMSLSRDLSYGFEYSNCCLKVGLMKRKWIDQDLYDLLNNFRNEDPMNINLDSIERERDNLYFFFELTELGRLGKKISDVVTSRSFE